MACWMVYKRSAFSTHWSDAYNSYGPFLGDDGGEKEAKEFAKEYGGRAVDKSQMSFGDKELFGDYS